MRPQLFRIPIIDWPVFSYGFMIMIGFIFAILYAAWRARKERIDPNYVFDVGLYAVVFGILGARAMYYWEFYSKEFPVRVPEGTAGAVKRFIEGQEVWLKPLSFAERPWYTFFYIHEGGIVFYGGLILAAAAIVAYLVREKRRLARAGEPTIPVVKLLDILACAVPIGLSFGRVGCFLNGCCWGLPAGPHALLAVQFPPGSPAFQSEVDQGMIPATAAATLPVHCTELYEWGGALLIAVILFLLYRWKRRDGQLVAMLLILYGPLRYVIEGVREQDPTAERTQLSLSWLVDPIAGKPMTNSQLVSWGILVLGFVLLAAASLFGPKYVPGDVGDPPAPKP